MHANSFTVSMFWNSFKLWLPHSLGIHLPPSVEHLTWIPVLQVYSLVSLKCQWPEVAVCDLIWIVLQFSRVAWSLVTTYTDESLPSVHFMDIICLCWLWDADVEYLSHIWSAMCYMWKKLQDIVCFLWKTSRQPQWTGASDCKSLMGKEVHRDEILRVFRHPHAPPQCALDSWPRLRVLKEHNIIK